MSHRILIYTILVFCFSGLSLGQDAAITVMDGEYQSQPYLDTSLEKPPQPIPLEEITDSLSDYTVGQPAVHRVGFQLPPDNVQPVGLLRGRQVVITFPPEFDVSRIDSVAYDDTDALSEDPVIEWIYIYAHSVVVRFSDKMPGPSGEYFAYITLGGMTNPTEARDYQVIVKVDNMKGQTVAGPGYSEPFYLLPGPAVTLDISPAGDMVLTAGDIVAFAAQAVDEYGNQIGANGIIWELDSELDQIGYLYGSVLKATAAGTGRVVARSGDLTAFSGLITVKPGGPAGLTIEIDRTQFTGHDFIGTARVTVVDRQGNIITNIDTSGIDFLLSADTGMIVPDILPSDQFQDGVAELSGYRYVGPPGPVTVTVSTINFDPAVEASAIISVNGIIAAFDDRYRVPARIPQNWEFSLRGGAYNPGNVTPIEVTYLAGFDTGEEPEPMAVVTRDCLPQAGDYTGCDIRSLEWLRAAFDPGLIDFDVITVAVYEFAGETITAEYIHRRPVEVMPFGGFEVTDFDFPETVIAADNVIDGPVTIANADSFEDETHINVQVRIVNELVNILLGHAVATYFWTPSFELSVPLNFLQEHHLPGMYEYMIITESSMYGEDIGLLRYAGDTLVAPGVEIIPRAQFSIDENSILPDSVGVGATAAFSLDIELDGSTAVTLDGGASSLTVSDGTVSVKTRLAEDTYTLTTGINSIAGMPVGIPDSWAGKQLTGRLHLIGIEADFLPLDISLDFALPTVIIPPSIIQIVALDIVAPNPPFVNTGQEFTLHGRITNRSGTDFAGPLLVTPETDGASTLSPPVTITGIEAGDTVEVNFAVTAADQPNPAEQFRLVVTDGGVSFATPADNGAVAVIQIPAALQLAAEIGTHQEVPAAIDYGESFEVTATFINAGQSQIDGGVVVLTYDGTEDFGIEFPAEHPLSAGMTWPLTAPDVSFSSEFGIAWKEIPIDRNTGLAVVSPGDPISLSFIVRESVTRIVVQADDFDTQPLQRGVSSRLFNLAVENVSNDSRNTAELQMIMIEITDRNGRVINAADLVAEDGSNFYLEGEPISEQRFINGSLGHAFSDFLITPGEMKMLEFRMMPRADASLDYFNMRLDGGKITAVIASGPRAGEPAAITGILDRAFEISLPQAIISEEFAESFKNYPNPFNPEREATEIRYFLPEDTDVDIYIYTVTGEQVGHMSYTAGTNGGQAGVNSGIFWDGRNGSGDMVLNGVYIAYIEAANGLTAKVKMAVVK